MASVTTYTCDFQGESIPDPQDVTHLSIQWTELVKGKRTEYQKTYELCPHCRELVLAVKTTP